MDLTRRGFLQSAGAATALLALQRLVPTTFAFGADGAGVAEAVASYRGWEDLYRGKWTWDKVVRSSHFVNCWYQAHCAWNVYVKDGVVWREYLETVVRDRREWNDLYQACRELG